MNWRLTAEERRIIERTRREGEQTHTPPEGSETEAARDEVPLWRSVLTWIGGIVLMVAIALFMVWVGSLITN